MIDYVVIVFLLLMSMNALFVFVWRMWVDEIKKVEEVRETYKYYKDAYYGNERDMEEITIWKY